jgi:ABC-type branched-subunit amino acid transport system ATPase component
MRPVIQVSAVRKTYGSTVAIDEVSFEVNDGEIFGLIRPNGAGKTTTGLIKPDWPMIACSLPDITDPWWTSFEWFGSRAVFSCTLPSTV